MKSAFALCILLLGCGGGAKPVPAKPIAKQEPATPIVVKEKQVVQPVADCANAARAFVKEHGFGKIAKEKQEQARIAAEAELVAACLDDQWTQPTIDCATSRAAPSSCLGQLSEYQEQSFRAHLNDWETNWTRGAERRVDEQLDPATDPTPGDLPKPKNPAEEEWLPCTLGDVASYEPQIKADAVDRDLTVTVRESAVRRSCEYHWANADKKCFAAAHDAAGIAACRVTLDPRYKNSIANALADADAKVAQIQAMKRNAKAIECKAVASAHYSDEMLRYKLGSLDPVERKRVFAESKQVMSAACAKDKWPPTMRACVVLSRPAEYDIEECATKALRTSFRFGVPAQGVFFKSGVPECDALGESVKKLVACDKFDERMKNMLLESYSMRLTMWLDAPAQSRLEVVKQCKQTQQFFEEDARERGCKI